MDHPRPTQSLPHLPSPTSHRFPPLSMGLPRLNLLRSLQSRFDSLWRIPSVLTHTGAPLLSTHPCLNSSSFGDTSVTTDLPETALGHRNPSPSSIYHPPSASQAHCDVASPLRHHCTFYSPSPPSLHHSPPIRPGLRPLRPFLPLWSILRPLCHLHLAEFTDLDFAITPNDS